MINHFNDFLYFRTITYSINDSVYIHVCLRNNYKAHNICKERKCKPRIFISSKTILQGSKSFEHGGTQVILCIPEDSTGISFCQPRDDWRNFGKKEGQRRNKQKKLIGSYTSIIVEIIF